MATTQIQDAFILVTALKAATQHGNLGDLLMPSEKQRAKELFKGLRHGKAYSAYLEVRTVESKPVESSKTTTKTEQQPIKLVVNNNGKTQKPEKSEKLQQSEKKRKYTCKACQERGHNTRNCPNKRHCGNCGRAADHNARTCPNRGRKARAA